MVPVGVNPVGVCADMCDSNVMSTSLSGNVLEAVLAGGAQIIYDFEYNARARELMTTSTDAAAGRFGPLAARPGQDHRDPPELRLARRSARPPPGCPVVLLQAVELGGGIRRHDRASRGHRAARVRGRDRPGHRRPGPARRARGRVGACRATSPPPTTSASTTCARTTRAPTSARRAATGSRRSVPTLLDARDDRPGAAARAHVGQRRDRAGRHDRRPASSPSPSSSPTSRSTSRSRPAT